MCMQLYDCDFLAGGIRVQPQVWGRPPAYREPSICIQIPVIFLWRSGWLLRCHLKVVLYPGTARLGSMFFFPPYLWPAGNTAYLKGTDLAEQPDCVLSPDCKSPHTPHAFPLFMHDTLTAHPVGARLVSSERTMAEQEDNVTIPEFNNLLQMDPLLKTYEKDFQRR